MFQLFNDKEFRSDIENFWLSPDLINYLLLTSIFVLVIVAFIWFILLSFIKYTNKNIKNLERIIIFNINTICFLLLSCFTIFKYTKIIDISDQTFFTWIGWILVFWWWYKKYQRDKEIELLQNFLNKENEFLENINNEKNDKNSIKKEFKNIFNLWEETYSLQDKSYISFSLWEEFKFHIKTHIAEFLFIDKNSDIFLEVLNEELKRIYYKPNNSSSYRFFVYFVEQIKKINKIKNLLYIWGDDELKKHEEKIDIFIKLSDEIISIPDIMYSKEIKNIKSLKEKIKKLQ